MARDQNIPSHTRQRAYSKRSQRRLGRPPAGGGKFDRALEDLICLIIQGSVLGKHGLIVRLFEMYKNAKTQENRRKVEKAFRVVAFELYYESDEKNDATTTQREEE